MDYKMWNDRTRVAQKGFTLVELLVLISALSIISSLALSFLSTGRTKDNDDAVKAGMKQFIIQAEKYRDSHSDFGKNVLLCTSGIFADVKGFEIRSTLQLRADPSAVFVCSTDVLGEKWALSISALRGGGSWCVDNSGWLNPGVASNSGTCR